MHTEQEAREKWCPFARHSHSQEGEVVSCNRRDDGDAHPYCLCIASDCAMWVEEPEYWTDGKGNYWQSEVREGLTKCEKNGHCGFIRR